MSIALIAAGAMWALANGYVAVRNHERRGASLVQVGVGIFFMIWGALRLI